MTSLILSHKSLSCISMHTSIYADIVSVQGPHFPTQQPIPWLNRRTTSCTTLAGVQIH